MGLAGSIAVERSGEHVHPGQFDPVGVDGLPPPAGDGLPAARY
jgi:hypothetical protein